MKINIMNKPCPSCKLIINVGLWEIRENVRRCPNCGVLLIENPKNKLVSGIVFFAGVFLATGSIWIGISIFVGLLLMIFSFIIALKIINLKIIKRDFVIRNKETNQISYINKSDWSDIENNSLNTGNNFEIVEHLSNKK